MLSRNCRWRLVGHEEGKVVRWEQWCAPGTRGRTSAFRQHCVDLCGGRADREEYEVDGSPKGLLLVILMGPYRRE
jgi:hypothetical protein